DEIRFFLSCLCDNFPKRFAITDHRPDFSAFATEAFRHRGQPFFLALEDFSITSKDHTLETTQAGRGLLDINQRESSLEFPRQSDSVLDRFHGELGKIRRRENLLELHWGHFTPGLQ